MLEPEFTISGLVSFRRGRGPVRTVGFSRSGDLHGCHGQPIVDLIGCHERLLIGCREGHFSGKDLTRHSGRRLVECHDGNYLVGRHGRHLLDSRRRALGRLIVGHA